jgi:hypothetical protein
MAAKTTRLIELPFDPYEKSSFMKDLMDDSHLSIWFKLWHWHLKKYVEPFYPRSIYYLGIRIYQKLTKGYTYVDMWGLDCVFTDFILPRLKEFRRRAADPNIMSGYPFEMDPCYPNECGTIQHEPDIGHRNWLKTLDEMIYAFEEMHLDDTNMKYNRYYQSDEARIQKGKELFAKYYENLWE